MVLQPLPLPQQHRQRAQHFPQTINVVR